jgi:gentisate 1,2-dioxygenase
METIAFYTKPETSAEREEFYRRLDTRSAAPLWKVLGEIVTPQPRTPCLPVMWSYEEMRPLVLESGQLISAKEAERRVLMLENPGLRGASSITRSLYAGLQLVLPGEVTPTHRHAAAALRFVLEGVGAYTAVEGERITMHPGDLILTPSWTYHDHGNPSDVPVVWLDGLDIPTVNFFDASFAEHYPQETQPVVQNGGATFAYPYSRSRDALDRLYRSSPFDPCDGVKMQYATMPTIAAFLQLLPAGFRGEVSRSTDATVYCVVEGRGHSQVGDSSFEWKQHDIFVVPSWRPVSHEAQDESVLFSFSDRPAQKSLGLWREARQ